MHVDDPRFPPLLCGHGVRSPERAFAHACAAVATGRLGAADLVWSRNVALVELALILEPDVSRRRALEMIPLFQLAVIEAIGALMPPKTSVLLRWPDVLVVNGARAGRFQFALSLSPDDVEPDWMVLSVSVALRPDDAASEPGVDPERTCLLGEGAEERTRSDFLEVISSYFLSWLDSWRDGGFAAVHDGWVGRVEGHGEPAALTAGAGEPPVTGSVLGLDEDMRLLVKVAEMDVRALPLEHALALDRPLQDAS